MTLTFGSLFAGIGGIDLGLERAGMVCKWQVEIDPFCQKVLAKHWPNVERFEDVRECGRHNLEAVDLICGGFPCQPHSVAGKRKGAEDDRNLWPEYRRIVAELRPNWILGENVPGIITTYLDTVLSDLESEGYSTTAFNLPACAFDAPHRRERIFIVAFGEGHRLQGNRTTWEQEPDSRRQKAQSQGGFEIVADANGANWWDVPREQCSRTAYPRTGDTGWWAVEPDVGRVAHGVPNRVDRLRALGNAVVPQVAEWIGRRIMAVDSI